MIGIYKFTNLLNGSVYIGSSYKDLEDRLYAYTRKTNSNVSKKVKESIKFYGKENHTIEILCQFEFGEIDKQLLFDFEDYYILHFLKELGEDKILNRHCNDKQKWMSKEYSDGLKNRPVSDETRKKQSDVKKGKKASNDTKLLMSKNNGNNGKLGILHQKSVKVIQFTKDGFFIKTWDSTMDVERELCINHSHISAVCKNKRKSAGGFIWKYDTEHQDFNI